MQTIHHKDGIAEIISDKIIISTTQNAVDLMMDMAFEGYRKVIFYKAQISPDFFELKTKLAGEIMQKMVNHDLHAVIVGDFSATESESLDAFIFECNKGKHLLFADTLEKAVELLAKVY